MSMVTTREFRLEEKNAEGELAWQQKTEIKLKTHPTQLCTKAGRKAVTWHKVSPDTAPDTQSINLFRQSGGQVGDTGSSAGEGWGMGEREAGKYSLLNATILTCRTVIWLKN